MTKFTTKAGKLLKLFELLQAEGTTVKGDKKPFNIHAVLHIDEKGIHCETQDENKALMCIGKLTDISDVVDPGDIPVEFINPKEKDKPNSIRDLKRYKPEDLITVEYTTNKNKIIYNRSKPKLIKTSPTIPMDQIKTKAEYIPFEYSEAENLWKGKKSGFLVDNYIQINAKEFDEVITDGNQIQHRSFPFTLKSDGTFNVITQDEESGESNDRDLEVLKIRMPDKKDAEGNPITEVKSIYAYGFGNAFGQIDGEIELWISQAGPMIIRWENKEKDLQVVYILATMKLRKEDEKPDAETKKKVDQTETDMLSKLDQDLADREKKEDPNTDSDDLDHDELNTDDRTCPVCGEPDSVDPVSQICSNCGSHDGNPPENVEPIEQKNPDEKLDIKPTEFKDKTPKKTSLKKK